MTLADDNGNWIETLPATWPTDVFGSDSFDIPDALVSSSAVDGTSNTYKGINPFDPAETLYFDETGTYLGSVELGTSDDGTDVTGYSARFFDVRADEIGYINYNITPADGSVSANTYTSYEEALLDDVGSAVYWDESAFFENGEAALSDGFTSDTTRSETLGDDTYAVIPVLDDTDTVVGYQIVEVQFNDGGTTVDPALIAAVDAANAALVTAQDALAAAEADLVTATEARDAAQAVVDAASSEDLPAAQATLDAAEDAVFDTTTAREVASLAASDADGLATQASADLAAAEAEAAADDTYVIMGDVLTVSAASEATIEGLTSVVGTVEYVSAAGESPETLGVYAIAESDAVMVDVSLPQVYVTIGSNSYSTYDATSGEWTEVSADASETFHAVQDDGYGGTFPRTYWQHCDG